MVTEQNVNVVNIDNVKITMRLEKNLGQERNVNVLIEKNSGQERNVSVLIFLFFRVDGQ